MCLVVGGGFEDLGRWDLGLGFLILWGYVVFLVGILLEGRRVEVVIREGWGLEELRKWNLREVKFGVREIRGNKEVFWEFKGVVVDCSLKGRRDFDVEGGFVFKL